MDISEYLDLGHWRWCRQRLIGRSDRCPCNDVPADMPFIDLDWLLDAELGNLPRMQDLPPEAFIYPPELDYGYFISHRWLSLDHPDKTGGQIALALPQIWSDKGRIIDDRTANKKTGIWYDFLCLPQAPRTASEDRLFQHLFKHHSYLTITNVPILVLNSGFDYASRAWCVAENFGRIVSSLSGRSASMSKYVRTYGIQLIDNDLKWNQNLEIKRGFRPGFNKLTEWISSNPDMWNSFPEHNDRSWEQHKESLHRVNEVYMTFCIAMQKSYDLKDDRLLYSIAERHKLECTKEEDLIVCMRIMSDILTIFLPE